MLEKTLSLVRDQLQTYLRSLPDLNLTKEAEVHLSNVMEPDGGLALHADSLGMTLVNMEEERANKMHYQIKTAPNGEKIKTFPKIKLYVYILFASNFSQYATSLSYLNGTIRFFQSKKIFDSQNTPGLSTDIEKVTVEFYSPSFEEQSHIWGCLGSKFMPSAMYKLGLILVEEDVALIKQPQITQVRISEGQMS